MNYYHMTSLNNLDSISEKGFVPGSGANSKLIGDDKIRAGQVKLTDESIMQKIRKSKNLFRNRFYLQPHICSWRYFYTLVYK